MSFLVELAESAYPRHALDGLTLSESFSLDNARAMMWMSQLAYETADEKKVERILASWRMQKRDFESNDPVTGLPAHSSCVVIAGGRGATIVAFSGTDPLKIEDWITDFTTGLSTTNRHTGFERAVESVWPKIKDAIENRPADERALFFTGHSLGGALALIAAERAASLNEDVATAVYTFGGPRVGDLVFLDAYSKKLINRTYRMVHGGDVVPTVPPREISFCHVGECIKCPTDGRFDGTQTQRTDAAANEPDFIDAVIEAGRADFRAGAAIRWLRHIGPRPLDWLGALLPRMVRDHLPSNYFRALGVRL